MDLYKLKIYPNNRETYLKIITLGKDCLEICEKLKISPIIHGSIAYLFYTQDSEIEVNDLDLLIPESAMNRLAAEFAKRNMNYELTDHPTIKVIKDDAKVSFHSKEYFLNGLPKSSNSVEIEGSIFQVLNLKALVKGYEASLELESERSGTYFKKLEKLKSRAR